MSAERLSHPGTIISFEGIDGSGKTTQTQLLTNYLGRLGLKVLRSPDNSDTNEVGLDGQILSILRQKGDRFFRIGHPITETLLLSGRMAYITETVIAPALREGNIIISDRDVDTFISYGLPSLCEACPDKTPEELMDWMISVSLIGRVWPDLTILFRPEIDAFLSRATVGVHEKHKKDIFDDDAKAFIDQVIIYYEQLRQRFPERIQVVDISGEGEEEVFEKVLDIVLPFLEERAIINE
jgi:dTMP kinase